MSYDLRREPWIPFRRRSGRVEWGPPALLTDGIHGDDPVVALAAPRPDFDGALHEFLIGLLTVALRPANEGAWRARWDAPPTPEELQAAFDALPNAFDIDGEDSRVFQDQSVADLREWPVKPIEYLLIGAAVEETRNQNTDLFNKRDRVFALGYASAAMALITMQTYASGGGPGHRTSLRGGGPLTTLVDPRTDSEDASARFAKPLWQLLWVNVESAPLWSKQVVERQHRVEPESIFPWLAPTRVSENNEQTTPGQAHPWQSFFGLPRRIRLEFSAAGICGITGNNEPETVVGFRMRTYGVQYSGWMHPLSPHYRSGTGERLPVHPQPGGIGWKDWLGLMMQAPAGDESMPAATIVNFLQPGGRASSIGIRRVTVRAFGYDMNKAKARGWVDATLPAFAVPDEAHAALVWDCARRMTEAAQTAAGVLSGAVDRALFLRLAGPRQKKGDRAEDMAVAETPDSKKRRELKASVQGDLWAATESPFFTTMSRVADPATNLDASRRLLAEFRDTLADRTGEIFDRWCPTAGLAPEAMRRLVAARYGLVSTLRGYGKAGEKLYTTLDVPRPASAEASDTPKSHTRKVAPV